MVKKTKIGKIETRSDRKKKGGRKKVWKGGYLCLGVTFSAGGGLKGNNGGKDGGMLRMKG